MPIITRVETALKYWNHQYEIPDEIFIKHFGSFESFKTNHLDENGKIEDTDEISEFLTELEEYIIEKAECIADMEVDSEKHYPEIEYFEGKVLVYDRKIIRQD